MAPFCVVDYCWTIGLASIDKVAAAYTICSIDKLPISPSAKVTINDEFCIQVKHIFGILKIIINNLNIKIIIK